MSETKTTPWTPGEWWVTEHQVTGDFYITRAGVTVAKAYTLLSGIDDITAAANAHLIAAAPEMAALLERLAGDEGTCDVDERGQYCDAHAFPLPCPIAEARRLLAAINGEQREQSR